MLRTQGGEDELIETAGIKLNSRNIPQLLKVKVNSVQQRRPYPQTPKTPGGGGSGRQGDNFQVYTLNNDIWNQQFE